MKRLRLYTTWCGVLILWGFSTPAATYYVSPQGDDVGNGLSPATAFQTMVRGVAALEAGDTLVVGPGVYREEVFIEKSGTPENPIVIRAAVPGRAELVGSVRLTEWTPVRGRRQVFGSVLRRPTYLVYEKDTGVEYLEKAGLDSVEEEPGSFFYDAAAGRLFVHPSDDLGMAHHVVDACVLDHGLASLTTDAPHLHAPRRVGLVIEGLVVRDYNRYGIFIHNADDCIVRDCIVHHCRRGIFMYSALRSVITGCEVFACADRHNREQGNIGMMGYVFECEQSSNVVYDTRQHGIRFYGGQYGNRMHANLAYNCGIGLHVKGALYDHAAATRLARFSNDGNPELGIGLTNRFERNVCHQVAGSAGLIPNASLYHYNTGEKGVVGRALDPRNNLEFDTAELPAARFAAPEWHDFRLQSDSPYRGQGVQGADLGAHPYAGDVFFVGPGGDDAGEGTSVERAWRTLEHAASRLRPGATLYLLPGLYETPLRLKGVGRAASPTRVRARSPGTVTFRVATEVPATIEVEGCTNLWIEGLRIAGGSESAVSVRACEAVRIARNEVFDSAGSGVSVDESTEVRLLDNTIVANGGPAIEIRKADELTDGQAWYAPYWIVNNILRDNGAGVAGVAAALVGWCDYNNMDVPLDPMARAGAHNVDLAPGFVDAEARDFRLTHTSLCRGRGFLGRPIGSGRLEPASAEGLTFEDLRMLGASDTTADLAWSVRGGQATLRVAYGTDPANLHHVVVKDKGPWYRRHHVTTLQGLEPGTRYYVRVGARRLLEGPKPYHAFRYLWPERSPEGEAAWYDTLGKEDLAGDGLIHFVTRTQVTVSPRTWHVAPEGRDGAAGAASAPLRSLRRAAELAGPGDRVLVHAGRYNEVVRPRRSGLPGHPIVFEAVRGDRVEINGSRECIPFGFDLTDRHHIEVRGFVFFGQAELAPDDGGFGQVCVIGASDILVEQCLFDGRMNYINPVYIAWSRDVTIHNNIFVSHHASIMGHDNQGTITFTRNACLGPTLAKAYLPRTQRLVIRNNLFGEHLFPKKKKQYKLKLPLIGAIEADYNLYYFDPANDEMRLIDYMPATESAAETTALPEDDPRKARIGVRGSLEAWRETYGQGTHSLVADPKWADPEALAAARARRRGWPDRFFDYPPLDRQMFRLAENSPCIGGGEGSTNIGPDYTY